MQSIRNIFFLFIILAIASLLFQNLKTQDKKNSILISNTNIREMTDEKAVVEYLLKYNKLPNFYITKAQARNRGWISSKGNLCTKTQEFAIGGDIFSNRENILPAKKGRIYFEADINYNCGYRGTDRIVYSNDGLIFITKNHYKNFQKIK